MNLFQCFSKLTLTLILSISFTNTFTQDINRVKLGDYERDVERKVYHLPEIPGYLTLKADFHMHTVFSDGLVWPEFRVHEAWKEGLDVIAITDHIEYLPHKNNISGDHNTPYEIAKNAAEMLKIILIKGSEITRAMPPGHLNALFLEDATLLGRDDPMEQIGEAAGQGAFILWNHPGWASQQPDTTLWWDMHTTLLDKGWLHGVEVGNGGEWYPIVLDWCRDKKLAVFVNSDIHQPVDYKYDLSIPYSHRPMTLVFAKDRTIEGVREALFRRRTLGFSGTQLMGPEELILQVFYGAVDVGTPYYTMERRGTKTLFRELINETDLTFILEKEGEEGISGRIELHPHSSIVLRHLPDDALHYRLMNCWTASNEHPQVKLE